MPEFPEHEKEPGFLDVQPVDDRSERVVPLGRGVGGAVGEHESLPDVQLGGIGRVGDQPAGLAAEVAPRVPPAFEFGQAAYPDQLLSRPRDESVFGEFTSVHQVGLDRVADEGLVARMDDLIVEEGHGLLVEPVRTDPHRPAQPLNVVMAVHIEKAVHIEVHESVAGARSGDFCIPKTHATGILHTLPDQRRDRMHVQPGIGRTFAAAGIVQPGIGRRHRRLRRTAGSGGDAVEQDAPRLRFG